MPGKSPPHVGWVRKSRPTEVSRYHDDLLLVLLTTEQFRIADESGKKLSWKHLNGQLDLRSDPTQKQSWGNVEKIKYLSAFGIASSRLPREYPSSNPGGVDELGTMEMKSLRSKETSKVFPRPNRL